MSFLFRGIYTYGCSKPTNNHKSDSKHPFINTLVNLDFSDPCMVYHTGYSCTSSVLIFGSNIHKCIICHMLLSHDFLLCDKTDMLILLTLNSFSSSVNIPLKLLTFHVTSKILSRIRNRLSFFPGCYN